MWLGDLESVNLDEAKVGHGLVIHGVLETHDHLACGQRLARARHARHIHATARQILQVRLDEVEYVGELLVATGQAVGRVGHVELDAGLLVGRERALVDLGEGALLHGGRVTRQSHRVASDYSSFLVRKKNHMKL